MRVILSAFQRVNLLAGVLLLGTSAAVAQRLDITVQVFDGRNGKPMADQHVLVFTGLSADAVKTHAQHTGVTTGKDGVGTLTIYPGETQWLQVFTDGAPCFPDPAIPARNRWKCATRSSRSCLNIAAATVTGA